MNASGGFVDKERERERDKVTHNLPTRATTPNLTRTLSSSSSSSLSSSSSSSVFNSSSSGEVERSKSGSPKSMVRKLKSPMPDRLAGGGENKAVPIIRVGSERELTRELEDINTVFATQVDDWEKRVKALQRIQALALGSAADYPSLFLSLLSRLRDSIALQVADLRSSVSKEACATLTTLSSVLGDSFESLADSFIDVLLKCTIVTIQVISDSANKCIRAIIKQTRINRGVLKITEGAANKNGIIRSRSMEYILLLLGVAATPTLEKYVDQLETAIRNGVSDAVAEVRAAARSSFIVFCGHWELRGTKMLPAFEPHVRKLIHEEMAREDPNSTLIIPAALSSSGERPGSSTSKRGPVRASTPSSGGQSLSASGERANTPGFSRGPHRDTSSSSSSSTSLSSTSASHRKPERMESTTTPTMGRRDDTNGRPSSTSKQVRGTSTASMPPPHPSSHASHHSQPARAPSRDESHSDTSSNDSFPEVSPPVTTPPTHHSSNHSNLPPEIREFVNFDINKLFQEAESSLWSSRMEAFATLQRLIIASSSPLFPSSSFPSHIPRIVKLILERLADPHAKVVKAVLDTLQSLSSLYPQPLVPYLDRILPPMFVRLSGLKDEPRAQASGVLTALLMPLRGTVLLTSVLRVLDVLPPKPRGAALEYMLHLIGPSQEHLTYPTHMRTMVYKVLVSIGVATVGGATGGGVNGTLSLADPSQSGQIPPDLKRAGLQCLVELYAQYYNQFIAQLLSMPPPVQFEVKKLLAACQVNVDADLMNTSGKAFITLHPPSSTHPIPSVPSTGSVSNGKRPPSRNGEMEPVLQDFDQGDYPITKQPSDESLKDSVKANPIPNFGNLNITATTSKSTKPPTSTSTTVKSSTLSSTRPSPSSSTHSIPNGAVSIPAKKDEKPSSVKKTQKPNKPQSPLPPASSSPSPAPIPNSSSTSSVSSSTPQAKKQPQVQAQAQPQQTQIQQQQQSEVALALSHVATSSNDEEARREGLHRLVKLLREDPELVRSHYFEQMLVAVMECLREESPSMRELALVVLCEMVKACNNSINSKNNSVGPFEPFINLTVARVMEMFRDRDNPHVKQAAEDAMEYLLKAVDPTKCCAVLVALVQEEDGPVLQACVKYLAKSSTMLTLPLLRHLLVTMLPGLFNAFKNSNADVRKAVVFCLVDLYLVLGDELVPFLSSLTTSQRKLVTIYINRAKNKPPSPVPSSSSSESLG